MNSLKVLNLNLKLLVFITELINLLQERGVFYLDRRCLLLSVHDLEYRADKRCALLKELLQAAGDRRLRDMEVLAHLMQTQLNERALCLQEQGLLLDLVGVLHAVVEFDQELREEGLELLVGPAWLRETPLLLLLDEEVAYLVVVVADLLEVALREAAAVLLDSNGLAADGFSRVCQDLALPLRGTREHMARHLMSRLRGVAHAVGHGALLLVGLPDDGQLLVPLDLDPV